jgi:uncharacterized protein (TIGR00661 family)
MKILYAIQGTGNGHVARAREIVPILQKKGKLDVLISGYQADIDLPFKVKYKFHGLSFIFGKKGGIDILDTLKKSNIKLLYKEIKSLPIEKYDLVINDFEPVSAWACKLKNVRCIGLSHQAAVINKKAPKPNHEDIMGSTILKKYAPVDKAYGFHFDKYDDNTFTPVIRSQIRNLKPTTKNYYTVYLPAYSDEMIIKILSHIENVTWQVFCKNAPYSYTIGNISIKKIDNDLFIDSLVNCTGILCGGGFETPAEALYLNKKLMVIPMKGQYEQQCNAAALELLGVPVIKSLKKKYLPNIRKWVESNQLVKVNYPNETEDILDMILMESQNILKKESKTEKLSTSDVIKNKFKKLRNQLASQLDIS